MKFIRTLIHKIKQIIFYNRCYDKMENVCIAVFGMCYGKDDEEYRETYCKHCKYFRNLR